jgi:effector-associated domain 11 (EAD11)-containing protein/SIR2-like protein
MPPDTKEPANAPFIESNINWDLLFEFLEKEKCILCVGPGIFDSQKEGKLETRLARFLKEEEASLGIRVYEDGWFHYLPGANEIDAWQRVKAFYSQPQPEAAKVLQKLARIPFHHVLNFTPDQQMKEAYTSQNLPVDYHFYYKKEPCDQGIQKPAKARPLVFNMMGDVDERNSLVLTYDDFYAYLESVFEAKSMSPVLKANVFAADYFIFIGLPFEKWYMHLFMRILRQHAEKRKSKKHAASAHLTDEVESYCYEQYTITFVQEGISKFVDELFKKCEEKGLLKSTEAAAKLQLPFDTLRDLISENEFEKLFATLLEQLKVLGAAGMDFINMALNLEGQHNALKQKKTLGLLREEEEEVQTNNLRSNMLEMISELEKAFPAA